LKSRGMAHSHEMREFMLTNQGIRLGGNYAKGLATAGRRRKPGEALSASPGRG